MSHSIPEALWNAIAYLFVQKGPGRRASDPYNLLSGIFYVLRGGVSWRLLPHEYGKISTVHSAFMRWSRRGLFEKIHTHFVAIYIKKECPTYFALDAALHRARNGSVGLGPNPCDRRKNGTKTTIVVDIKGVPLICLASAANRHDIIPARQILEKIKALAPVNVVGILAADSAYDAADFRRALAESNIAPFITQNNRRKTTEQDKKLRSKHRWVVESTHSWLNNSRSLLVRYAKHDFAYNAFLNFACAFIVFKQLQREG